MQRKLRAQSLNGYNGETGRARKGEKKASATHIKRGLAWALAKARNPGEARTHNQRHATVPQTTRPRGCSCKLRWLTGI